MNRDDLIDYLAQRRLDGKKNVRDRQRMRDLIRNDLAGLSDLELQAEYDHATGKTRSQGQADAKDYGVTRLDHAITDALTYLERRLDHITIQRLLVTDYGADTAGRAFAMAVNGEYAIQYARSTPTRQIDLETAKPISLAEFRAIQAQAEQATSEAS